MKKGDVVFIKGSKGVAQVEFVGYDPGEDMVFFSIDGEKITGVKRKRWNTMITEIDTENFQDLPDDTEDEAL